MRCKMNTPHKPATDDVRIREIKEVLPPSRILGELTASAAATGNILATRQDIHSILHGADDRLLVIIGPCSIHDHAAALEYAKLLLEQRQRFAAELLIVMRVYFEKPRTTVGWKGLINDPQLDGSFNINEGLRLARRILLEINELGMPTGNEFLDVITPQYTADLVSWGAIGARTTESQVHRELASGLSCAVGFKNGTDGNIRIAVDAIKAAACPHHFLAVTKAGHSAIVSTAGNEDCHVILRGGRYPNYDAASVDAACKELAASGLASRVMIDCSHANSSKQYKLQLDVANDIATQIATGEQRIFGVMVESHLKEGRQELENGCVLEHGKSITDACLGWQDSVELLETLAQGVRARRRNSLDAEED
jgi:3-deoxy-7-phosphoheptulonate synthase